MTTADLTKLVWTAWAIGFQTAATIAAIIWFVLS